MVHGKCQCSAAITILAKQVSLHDFETQTPCVFPCWLTCRRGCRAQVQLTMVLYDQREYNRARRWRLPKCTLSPGEYQARLTKLDAEITRLGRLNLSPASGMPEKRSQQMAKAPHRTSNTSRMGQVSSTHTAHPAKTQSARNLTAHDGAGF